MQQNAVVAALGAVFICAYGCSHDKAMSIDDAGMAKVTTGMPEEAFLAEHPNAIPKGWSQIGGHKVTRYDLTYYHQRSGFYSRDDVCFFFADGRLRRWGENDEYPTAAELAEARP